MVKILKPILILAILILILSSNLLGMSLFSNTYNDKSSQKTCEYLKGRFGSFDIRDDKLYVLSGMSLSAYDLLTEEKLWESTVYGESWSRLFFSNDSIYFGSSSLHFNKKDKMLAINPKTGEKIWDSNYGLYPTGNVSIEKDVLYFGAQSIYSLNSRTGGMNWFINTYSFIRSGPIFSQDILVFINQNVSVNNGKLNISPNKLINAIDMNGKKIWDSQLVISDVFTISNDLIICNKLNRLTALDLFTGESKWEQDLKGNVVTLFTDNGAIYYGDNKGNLVALVLESHQEKWRFQANGSITSNPVIHNNIIYFASSKNIYGLDIASGAEKWRFQTKEKPGVSIFSYLTTPVIYSNYLYFLDSKGNLCRVNIM